MVVVTKGRSIYEIEQAILAGVTNFAENYLQEALSKWVFLKKKYPNVKLHFIGGIQSNKLKKILNLFDIVQSIDRLSLISILTKIDSLRNKDLYIEVKAESKNLNSSRKGADLEVAADLINYANKNNIHIKGIMGIAPVYASDSEIQEYFLKLKKLKDDLNLDTLSIGMSNDYILAIKSGSNMVRIGTKIFS